MFDDKLNNFSDVPLKENDRKKTDIICTIIGGLFALVMFILAFALMNRENYYKTNYPTDSDNIPCSYGANANYPFVYFPDINNFNNRVCVSRCPSSSDLELSCRVNSHITNCAIPSIYSASVNFDRLGGFCAPNDSAAQQKLITTANLQQKWNFLSLIDSVLLGLLISLAIGIVWLFFVQLIPRVIAAIVVFLSILILIIGGVLGLLDNTTDLQNMKTVRVILSVLMFIFAFIFATFICFYQKRQNLTGLFLEWSTKYLRERCLSFAYILLFIVLTFGLLVLIIFQHLAYLSHSETYVDSKDVYLQLNYNIVLLVLNIVELIWGIQFLKDSFNFVISGLAAQWYTKTNSSYCLPTSRIIKNHFGSIVGGSFLNAFFNIIDFLLEVLRCYPDGACGACAPCCGLIFDCCANFFDLVRTDVYAYINLTGIAYCNAARNCQHLIHTSRLFVGSQSLLYFYRISAYTFTVGTTVLLGYLIEKSKIGTFSVLSLVVLMVLSYCILAYFVDIHANGGEGLQISYLIERSLSQNKDLPNDEYQFKKEISVRHSDVDGKFC